MELLVPVEFQPKSHHHLVDIASFAEEKNLAQM
jgi:hypothetical protein